MVYKPMKQVSPKQINSSRNKKCSECGQPMTWMEGQIVGKGLSLLVGKYTCKKCHIFCKAQDSRDLMKGRHKAKDFNNTNFKWTDIAHLSLAQQLGILREIQHVG